MVSVIVPSVIMLSVVAPFWLLTILLLIFGQTQSNIGNLRGRGRWGEGLGVTFVMVVEKKYFE
jgi:hypothetical protein